MHAQALVAYGCPLERIERQIPPPKGTEILLRVTHCGLCHSDLHVQDGYFDLGEGEKLDIRHLRSLPFILGHEITGIVEATGEEAGQVVQGRSYVVYPWIGCGECGQCHMGAEHYCTRNRHMGVACDGGFAEYILVPHPRYLIDYGDVPPALAGTYMCSGLTAYGALKKLGTPAPSDTILIVGLGGVGMMALNFARALFKSKLMAADIDESKRALARELGAVTIDPRAPDAFKQILKESNGGVYGAADFVGSAATVKFAFDCLAKGGKVVVSGMFGGKISLPTVMFPIRVRGIAGSFIGSLTEAREMMSLVREGNIGPIPVEERALSLASQSLDDLRAGKIVGRVVLKP
jgi:D-arabinose 1-dehydrogenase-like Zn-dependent alcohol dehydrogenase